MAVKLLNSKMMPSEGIYVLREISPGAFAEYVAIADAEGVIAALNYRVDAPTKGAPVNERDFEFFQASYWPNEEEYLKSFR